MSRLTPQRNETRMRWTLDATGLTYICTLGSDQALIWRTFTGAFVALICQDHVAIGHEQCRTLEEAQAWCEARLAELTTRKRR